MRNKFCLYASRRIHVRIAPHQKKLQAPISNLLESLAIRSLISMSRELYISVDVETSGPIPGEYSLLSIGACVVGSKANPFYIELKPLNENFTTEAMATCQLVLADLEKKGIEPPRAMKRFARWVKTVAGDARPIFVGFNAPFDWSFINYYFIKFVGLGKNPFGYSALDIKSYYMGAYKTSWQATSMRQLPPAIHPRAQPLNHHALEDAMRQAEIFEKLLQVTGSK